MMFWLVLCLLAAVASLFVIAPLLIRGSDEAVDRQAVNLELYRENVAELTADNAESALIEIEAKKSLLEDVDEDTGNSVPGTGHRSWLVGAGLAVPLLALALYGDFGAGRGAITDVELTERLRATDTGNPLEYAEVVDLLADRAGRRPDDGELHFFLARSYSALGRYDDALGLFERLIEMYPDDAGLHSYYAETMFVADDRRMTPRVQAALDSAMQLNPHDVTLLEIQGIAAISSGNSAAALEWFSQALATGVSGERAELIRSAIATLHREVGTVPDEAKGRSLSIAVSAAADAGLPGESAVFVYARAVDGPPAPLAVQRMTLSQLPANVRLDESMAMMPGMGLADYDRVVVIVRVSQTGDVMPKPGDLEARSAEIDLNQPPALIEIEVRDPVSL